MNVKPAFWILISAFSVCFTIHAKTFSVVNTLRTDPEMGTIEEFLITDGDRQFMLRPPPGANLVANEEQRKISISLSDEVAIEVKLKSDYPSGLPSEEVLKTRVLQLYEGSAVLKSEKCYSGTNPGWLVDVKRVYSSEVSVTTRHAFIPVPGGVAEFIFSAESSKFEKQQYVIGNLLNSFRPNS